ncbi:MAG: branched-chain amino acid ABC transporter permease [Nitrospinota bacterium]|nr:MAG: branched-chain amino acid ABC transporter permease [Nitrospinota bacterium]
MKRASYVLLFFFVMALLLPLLAQGYALRIFTVAYFYAILASSWNLLAGYTGQLSFAHAAFAGIGAYTAGLLSLHTPLPPVIGVFLGGVMAGVLGYILGIMGLRLRGPYLSLITLAFSEIVRIVVTVEHEITRGSLGLHIPPFFPEGTSPIIYYYGMLVLLLLSLLALSKIVHSHWGLYLQAIREDEEGAAVMGVDVVRWKIFAFVVSSFFAGLAGGYYGHFVRVVSPHLIFLSQMGLILAMTVIGGMGTLVGPVMGAIIVYFISEQVRDFGEYHLVLFSLLVILVMKFFREGLYGLLRLYLVKHGWLSRESIS